MFKSVAKLAPLKQFCSAKQICSSHRSISVGVLGAPFNKGQKKEGVERGPDVIRQTGIFNHLKEFGHDVKDYGDVTPAPDPLDSHGPSGERFMSHVLDYNRHLSQSVSKVIQDGRVCVTLGGDHSIGIGTVIGHAEAVGSQGKQVSVLWVDAHADVCRGIFSHTGNMHGMPVGYLVHEISRDIHRHPSDQWPTPCMSLAQIVYIGVRDMDRDEVQCIRDFNVLHFSVQDIDRLGLNVVLAQAFKHLQLGPQRSLHVSFDIDALDPLEAPSTGTPVRGGLTLREGQSIVESARATGCLRALDMVEVNPALGSQDDVNRTLDSARHILMAALDGHRGANPSQYF